MKAARPSARLKPRVRAKLPGNFQTDGARKKPSTKKPGKPSAILEVSQLHIRRGNTVILKDVSWRVLPREHWAVLGANGSGKTSLLSALAGYLTPTAGTISVLGQTYGRTDWRELRKAIGIVSSSIRQMMANDEPAIQTVISGKYAVIDFWGNASKSDQLEARRILRQVECEHLVERIWGVLSQGERQRVLIGRALMANPRLLILDEPCAGLDPAAREHFLLFLDRLCRKPNSPTLILVTHHVEEIMPAFSHVLILKAGDVLTGGKKTAKLTSTALGEAFSSPMRLQKRQGRYLLKVGNPQPSRIL